MFKTRRDKLNELINVDIAVVFSGTAPMKSLDEVYPFFVDRNFFYLTGIDKENMIYVHCKDNDKYTSYLFIERFDEVKAKWVGARMLADEAKSISGIDNVMYVDEFEEFISGKMLRMRGRDMISVALDLWHNEYNQKLTRAHVFANELKKTYPNVVVKDIFTAMANLRIVKDEFELEQMKKAQEYMKVAIEEMLLTVKPNMNESAIEGAFDYALRKQCVREHAFKSIVAGGKRATVLHYSDNNQIVNDNELVLTDIGCTCGHYASDITRAFPANGKFTERQREVYSKVLEGQKLVISLIKPGVTTKELNDALVKFYETAVKDLGLSGKVSDYYYHGVSHQLGLDTHDIAASDDFCKYLKPGMVITVEPGLYIAEEGIGVRIEDDVLVTEEGSINLSADIIKEPDDIEKFMARA